MTEDPKVESMGTRRSDLKGVGHVVRSSLDSFVQSTGLTGTFSRESSGGVRGSGVRSNVDRNESTQGLRG